jgi:hypothetical protein
VAGCPISPGQEVLKVSAGPPVIILGAERSGTSVCAEMVHAWGAYAGEPGELAAPDQLNPHSRWEFLPLWDLLAAVGDFAVGGTWWQESFQENVGVKAGDPRLAGRARPLVARMEAGGRPWMWKDPALCHFLPFWMRFLARPVFVVTVRDPVDVALSWNQFRTAGGQGETSVSCNLLRWQHMMLSVLRATDRAAPALFIEYEQVTSDPAGQARRLAAFLDTQCGNRPSAAVEAMAAACDPALHRNREGKHRRDLMTEGQRSLHDFLRTKIHQPEAPFRERYPMPPGWHQAVISEEDQARYVGS